MTRLCVPIFVTEIARAKRDIATAIEAGAEIVELRIDGNPSTEAVLSLIAGPRVPFIVTCRSTDEGGNCTLSAIQRLELLRNIASRTSSMVDVELATLHELSATAQPLPSELIISSHDFNGRPARLHNLILEMNEQPATVNKIVWTARSIRDNIEAFEILRTRQRPTIALCMGEHGLISRILARKFGAFLTFASLDRERETAPGQVLIADMKSLFRWDFLSQKTKVYGVVGSPVSHSMSPVIHNAAFEDTGFDGIYLPLLVNPGYESFKAFMESFLGFGALDLRGLSITIPHKENALRYLSEKSAELDPLAVRIGAVNTIAIERDDNAIPGLRGLNTDYSAILDSITERLGIRRENLVGCRIAVIGAGGTGRTAVAALASCGATVVVYNRTRERAAALAAEFDGKSGHVVAASLEKICDSCCQMYINTTSIGMHPSTNASPFGPLPPKLGPDTLVFDAVYNPMRTLMIRQAEEANAKTVTGVEMFVRQAAAQFEAWTHLPAPIERMKRVLKDRLGAGENSEPKSG